MSIQIKTKNITASEIFRLFLLNNNDLTTTNEENVKWFKEAIDVNMEDHTRVWFKMFKGDTAATTVKDIVHNIVELPSRHKNYKYMLELLEIAIKNPRDIEIYIDKSS